MNDDLNQAADRAEREPKATRFSPTQMAAAGIGSAIMLLVVMLIVFLLRHM